MDETESTTKNRERGLPSRLKGRAGSANWVVGAAVLFVGAMVLLPVSSAGPVGAGQAAKTVTVTAPYPGTSYDYAGFDLTGVCGFSWSIPTTPHFNNTSGIFKGAVTAGVSSCGGVEDYIATYMAGALDPSGLSFTVPSTGKYSVVLHWIFHIKYTVSATSTGSDSAYASVYLYDDSWVENQTTTLNTIFSTHPSIFASTTSGAHTVGITHHLTAYLNGTYRAGDTYVIFPWIYGNVWAQVTPGTGSAGAYASLDVGSGGYAATLTSVVEPT